MTLLHLTDLSSEPLHTQISRQLRAKILAADLIEGRDQQDRSVVHEDVDSTEAVDRLRDAGVPVGFARDVHVSVDGVVSELAG